MKTSTPQLKKPWRPASRFEISRTDDTAFLTLQIHGPLTASEMIAAIKNHYPELNGRGVLWDLSFGDMRRLTEEDFAAVAEAVTALPDSYLPRRTACYARDQATFAQFCTYMVHAMQARIPVEYCVFSDLARAQAWLTTNG